MSFRNLPKVQIIGPGELNAYDVLCNEWVVFTKEVLPAGTSTSAPAEPTDKAKKPVAAAKSAAAAEGSPSGVESDDSTRASDEAGVSADQEVVAPASGEAETGETS